jgi:hypothetical protein
MIDSSSIGDIQKTALKSAVSSAADNPDLVSGVLDQVKSALGM